MSGPRSGLVAVVFTDLVGSTELMSQLGDRAFDDLRRQHFAALSKAVAAHGGEEVKNTGDGLMAVFPSAAEAVEAAVAMQQATARQSRSHSVAIRVGIAVGDATFEGDDYFGTPVVEAARLVAAARPGQILATQIARALAGSRCTANFTDQGPLVLKGLPEPVAVCEVGWEAASSSVPMPALLTGVGRVFVGRDAESERLKQLWKEAVAGERRVALLAGEPGVGKTRLAAELAGRVHEQGAVVLAGRCDEDLGVPFQPFVEALQHYGAHHSEPRLGRFGGELTRLLPELAAKVPGLPEPLRSDPETERYRLFDAVAAWLSDVSADDPVLLVLDDVHWAAKPTLLLLRHVLRSAEPLRLVVVATYRDSEVGRGHPLAELLADLRRLEGVERFPLTGLDQAGVAAFIEAAAGHALSEDDEGLTRAVWTETEGNPFFVVEVLRHLAETGGVEQRDGRWVMTAPVDELGIPEGVRDVVGRRLSRLSEAANRALWVASVVGLEFDPAVVRMAGDLSDEALFSSLEEAAGARLVSEVGTRYRFGHALVRATLYDEMTAVRRVALHRRVAEAIETIHAGALDDHLPALAHHWARASAPAADTDRAVDYATRAGDRALTQLAHDEAVAYYRQALELLGASDGLRDDRRRLNLLISVGEAEKRAGDPTYGEHLFEAARLAQQQGDHESLARAALTNCRGTFSSAGTVDVERVRWLEAALEAIGDRHDTLKARLLANLSMELDFGASLERRMQLSGEALALARRIGDPAILASVLVGRTLTIWDPSTVAERLELTAEAMGVAEQINDPTMRFWALYRRCPPLLEAGRIEEAKRHVALADQVAEDLGQPFLRSLVNYTQATVLIVAGRLEEAEQHSRTALSLGQQAGQADAGIFFACQLINIRYEQGAFDPDLATRLAMIIEHVPYLPFLRALDALMQHELGSFDEARVAFDTLAADGFADVPRNNTWTPTMALAATVCAALGDQQRAGILHDLIVPYEDLVAAHSLMWFGAFHHHLGLLDQTLGRFDDAAERFAAATATHDRTGARCSQAHTQLEWARTLLIRGSPGDAERARTLLGEALTTARALGLGGVERQAAAQLGGLP
jgi:class 3 adenylate cyclase/tetratricopeptide (TPR) repeat protein